jgi:hypothetical protein
MSTTFRANKKLEELLSEAAELTGKSRSEIIREAVEQYCTTIVSQFGEDMSWLDVLKTTGWKPTKSGLPHDRSTNKEYLKKVIRERANRRSS